MSTLLIKPNGKSEQYGKLEPLSAIEPPLWLALYANEFDDPILLDAEAEGLSVLDVMQRVDYLKPDNVIIFATGSHPSAHIQQKAKANELAVNLLDYKPQVIDYLPFDPTIHLSPRWDLLDMRRYRAHNWHCWGGLDRNNYGVVYSSISCPFSCKFCTVKSFYRQKYKVRKPTEVVNDILDMNHAYGTTNFKMMDELFVTKTERVKEICRLLDKEAGDKKLNIWAYARIDTIDKEMVTLLSKAGIKWIALGIESGNPTIRSEVSKGNFTNEEIVAVVDMLKDSGISVLGNYMFGFWNDTIATMTETLDLAMRLQCEYSNFYCVTAYPDSELYYTMKKKGLLLPTQSIQFAQLSKAFLPLRTQYLSGESVLEFRDMAFKAYYNDLDYLDMMEIKFGTQTKREILDMTSIRNIRE